MQAAILLSQGHIQQYVADECGMGKRTLQKWVADPDFSAEVDRLSLMMGIAARAERLRIAQRVVRQRVRDDMVETDKDLLEWLKFAQSETDGAKLDIAAFNEVIESLAQGEPGGAGCEKEAEPNWELPPPIV